MLIDFVCSSIMLSVLLNSYTCGRRSWPAL